MATKAKKLAKYSDLQEDLQEIIGKELPINAARVKFYFGLGVIYKGLNCPFYGHFRQ